MAASANKKLKKRNGSLRRVSGGGFQNFRGWWFGGFVGCWRFVVFFSFNLW